MVTVMIVSQFCKCMLCRHFVDDKEDDDDKEDVDDREDCEDCDDDDKKCDSNYEEKMTMTMMIGVLGLAAPPSDPLSSP